MDKTEKPRTEQAKKQERISQQWHTFANTYGREAYEDLMEYITNQMEMYIKYGSELQMPSPAGKGLVPIDLQTAAILLQNRRGMDIVRTYIANRATQSDVVPPKKSN